MNYRDKECRQCGEMYAPTSGRQKRCDDCRLASEKDGWCECGSPISGRELWGRSWGGECDRAERRASVLVEGLRARFQASRGVIA